MLHLLAWLAGLYVALKLCHVLAGSARGYRREDLPLATRLRAGEPWLLIGSTACVVAIAAYGTWWGNRFAERAYADATRCYGTLGAVHHLGVVPGGYRSYRFAEAVRGSHGVAQIHGSSLGIDRVGVDRALKRSMTASARRYAEAAASRDGKAISAALHDIDGCLNGAGAPRGEIFRPGL